MRIDSKCLGLVGRNSINVSFFITSHSVLLLLGAWPEVADGDGGLGRHGSSNNLYRIIDLKGGKKISEN